MSVENAPIPFDTFMAGIKRKADNGHVHHVYHHNHQTIVLSGKHNPSVSAMRKLIVEHNVEPKCLCCNAKAESAVIFPGSNKGLGVRILADNGQFLSIDHIKPKAAGGFNVISNYQILCVRCNSHKGDRTSSANANVIRYVVAKQYMWHHIRKLIGWKNIKYPIKYRYKKFLSFITLKGLYTGIITF